MDYNSIDASGISNFSSPSPHRLPTVSAAQALNDIKTSETRCISTGLRDLDCALQNREPLTLSENETPHGGVPKGKVTEIYGPPGVGKTTLGMQLAASALNAGEGVIWVDAAHPLSGPRFSQILTSFRPVMFQTNTASSSPPQPLPPTDLLDNLTHFSTPTLAHLLALLAHPNATFPAPTTGLIIIDSLSTLISNAFPRTVQAPSTSKKPLAPNPSTRKFPILQYLINSFQKLAATRSIAIVIQSQCITKMRPGSGAVLVPAINTAAWEQGLACRVALFRDWGWDDDEGNAVNGIRLAEVVKAEGVSLASGRGRLIGFTIGEIGLQSVALPTLPNTYQQIPRTKDQTRNQNESPLLPRHQKRKLSATSLEVPDSEGEDDEDYGWAEEDEEDMPPMPPQWQGSEDILVPPPGELDNDDEDEDLVDVEQNEAEADEDGILNPKGSVMRYGVVEDSEDELAL